MLLLLETNTIKAMLSVCSHNYFSQVFAITKKEVNWSERNKYLKIKVYHYRNNKTKKIRIRLIKIWSSQLKSLLDFELKNYRPIYNYISFLIF